MLQKVFFQILQTKHEEDIVSLKESIAGFKSEIESLEDQIETLETELADRAVAITLDFRIKIKCIPIRNTLRIQWNYIKIDA